MRASDTTSTNDGAAPVGLASDHPLPTDRGARRAVLDELFRDRHTRKDALRALFDRHMTAATTIRCVCEDHIVHLDPRDGTITPAVLEKGHWNRDEFERAIHILIHAGDFSLGGIFLDVGANIGTQSLYALRNGRFGRIVAYEPEPSNAALFRLNMEENERAVPVTLRECAVGAASGEGTLERHASNFGAHRVRTASHSDHQTDHQTGKHSEEDEATAGDALRVEIVTLDEDLAALEITPEQVSLVWIDVEGSEADVIEGANALVAAGRPLVFELLERDRTRETTAQMLSQLAAHYTHVARLQDGVFGKERMDDAGFDRPHDLPAGDYLVWRRT